MFQTAGVDGCVFTSCRDRWELACGKRGWLVQQWVERGAGGSWKGCVGYSGAPWGGVFGSCFPRHTAITARAWHKCRPKLRDCPESLATAVGPQRWAEEVRKGKPSCSCWTQAGVAVTVLPHGPLPRLAPGVTHTAPVAATRERF